MANSPQSWHESLRLTRDFRKCERMALRKHLNVALLALWGWVAWPLQRHLCAAYGSMWHMKADWNWLWLPYPSPLPLPFSCCNRTKQMPELTWGQLRNCIRDKQRSESHLYLFDYYLYAPSPGRNVKCRHSPMYVWCVWVCVHVCVACANNKQSAMMMSLLRGSIWSAAGQKDIDCQDFATLSFRLRPTPARRPLWCATWHCYMWPPLEVAASRPGRLAKTMPTTHSSYHRIYK